MTAICSVGQLYNLDAVLPVKFMFRVTGCILQAMYSHTTPIMSIQHLLACSRCQPVFKESVNIMSLQFSWCFIVSKVAFLSSGASTGYLANWLAPGSTSDSVSQSPHLVSVQDRQMMASEGPSSSQGSSARDSGPRIFVGKLVRGTTESDVRDYFSKFG